jgi:hypothetical protein
MGVLMVVVVLLACSGNGISGRVKGALMEALLFYWLLLHWDDHLFLCNATAKSTITTPPCPNLIATPPLSHEHEPRKHPEKAFTTCRC